MNFDQICSITPIRDLQRLTAEPSYTTANRQPSLSAAVAVACIEDQMERSGHVPRSVPSLLCHLPQAQNQFFGAIEAGCSRLSRNSDRMESTAAEASSLGRTVLQRQLEALGFMHDAASAGQVGARGTGYVATAFDESTRSIHMNSEATATRSRQAGSARQALEEHVLSEARTCALLREEVAKELESVSNWHRQWAEFFSLALQVTQGQQQQEVTQLINFVQARRQELDAEAKNAREQGRFYIERCQADHTIKLQNRREALVNDVERKRCDTDCEMAARKMGLSEREEAHNFDLGRAKLALEDRRSERELIASVVSAGIRVFRGGF